MLDDFIPNIPETSQRILSGIHLTEDLFQEPRRNAVSTSIPRARDSFITPPTNRNPSRSEEQRDGRSIALLSAAVMKQKTATKTSKAVASLPSRQVAQEQSHLLPVALTSTPQRIPQRSPSPIDDFVTPSPHQNASPASPRDEDDIMADEDDFEDARRPMDLDDEDETSAMEDIEDTPVRPSTTINRGSFYCMSSA